MKTFFQICEMLNQPITQIDQNNLDYSLVNILRQLTHKQKVFFAFICAKEAYKNHPTEQSKTCFDLIEKWLENPKTVTRQQLRTAAHTAGRASASANAYAYAAPAHAAYSAASVAVVHN